MFFLSLSFFIYFFFPFFLLSFPSTHNNRTSPLDFKSTLDFTHVKKKCMCCCFTCSGSLVHRGFFAFESHPRLRFIKIGARMAALRWNAVFFLRRWVAFVFQQHALIRSDLSSPLTVVSHCKAFLKLNTQTCFAYVTICI